MVGEPGALARSALIRHLTALPFARQPVAPTDVRVFPTPGGCSWSRRGRKC